MMKPGQAPRLRDFFLARQPILDRRQDLVAYELLFRAAAHGPANVTDDLEATASVIAHAAELGLGNVIGESLGFINVDAAVLMSDFVRFLPPQRVVLEILETVKVDDAVVARVTELAGKGYTFALDDVVADSEDVRRLLPLVSIIKVDISGMDYAQLTALSAHFRVQAKKLLAEKVETIDEFRNCLELGFDYFQGYYFAKPVIMSGKKLSPSQMAIMQLIAQLGAEADTTEIERSFKSDAALSLMLLRLVNTPAIAGGTRVDSLAQALMRMGRRQLQRWLQILLYANPGVQGQSMSPLLALATTRGKLLELLAEKMKSGDRAMADTAFTVGIMSLMDALFGVPMEKIVDDMSVSPEVEDALVNRRGTFGELLQLVESMENMADLDSRLLPALHALRLTSDELYALQVSAFEWSDKIARHAG
jgi:EAL and modified HD-GYP domain-containing signal transduction protein